MKRNMMIICIVLTSICLPSCNKKEIYTFQGGNVTLSDIDNKISAQLKDLEQKEYQIQQKAGYDLAMERIIELEAIEQKSSKDQLLQNYWNKHLKIPDNKTLKDFYKSYKLKQPFIEMRQRIYDHIVQQDQSKLQKQYFSQLSKKYQLKLQIERPALPSLNIDIKDEPFWGKENAKVIVVEFSDYQCPYCKQVQPIIQQIKTEYQDKIKWIFKDYPLGFHKQAKAMHIAANCAGEQNQYFHFQQQLFGLATEDIDKQLLELAHSVKLDINSYQKCVQDVNKKQQQEIQGDISEGNRIGVKGTPSFFVNGEQQNSFRTYEAIKAVLDTYLR